MLKTQKDVAIDDMAEGLQRWSGRDQRECEVVAGALLVLPEVRKYFAQLEKSVVRDRIPL